MPQSFKYQEILLNVGSWDTFRVEIATHVLDITILHIPNGRERNLLSPSPPLWKVLLIAIFKCLHFSLGITLTSGILHFSNMGVNSKIVLTETRQSAFFLTFVCWHTAKDIYIIYWRYVSKIFYYAHVFSRIRHRHYCDCEADWAQMESIQSKN